MILLPGLSVLLFQLSVVCLQEYDAAFVSAIHFTLIIECTLRPPVATETLELLRQCIWCLEWTITQGRWCLCRNMCVLLFPKTLTGKGFSSLCCEGVWWPDNQPQPVLCASSDCLPSDTYCSIQSTCYAQVLCCADAVSCCLCVTVTFSDINLAETQWRKKAFECWGIL